MNKRALRVLVACEYSGRVREAFRARGHDAYSCDLLPSDDESPYHIQGDVLPILSDGWELLIAHPPCTYFTNTAVCWLHNTPPNPSPGVLYGAARWEALDSAGVFFTALYNAPVPRIAIENPIPHKYALERIPSKYSQVIQPYQFGHPERKATCLWLKGLPPLTPTNIVALPVDKSEAQRLHYLPPSPDRWKLRSTTFQGIADAMAAQWSTDDE